MLYFDIL